RMCLVLFRCVRDYLCFFFFQAEDGIRDRNVTGVQTCALPISNWVSRRGVVVATIVSYTARPRRLTQFVLLVFAVVIGLTAYALVGLGRFEELPANLTTMAIAAT